MAKAFLKGQGGGRSHPGDPRWSPGTPARDHSERLLLIGELLMWLHLFSAPLPRDFQDALGTACDSRAPARVWHNLSEMVNTEPLGFLICVFVVVIPGPLFLVDLVAAATLVLAPPHWGPLSGLLPPLAIPLHPSPETLLGSESSADLPRPTAHPEGPALTPPSSLTLTQLVHPVAGGRWPVGAGGHLSEAGRCGGRFL